MNFDYVEFLKDYVRTNSAYERYIDMTDNSYFDEVDYISIKLCLSIVALLEDNQKMRFILNGGDIRNEDNK